MARKSDYNTSTAREICRRIADGESLRKICAAEGMPNKATVLRWLDEHEKFRDQYARARELQADHFAEEIIDIAEEQAVCYTESGTAFDPDVQRDRLRIDARKWFASKVAPKKYGDKLELGGDRNNPLTVEIVNFAHPAPRK